jgi:hypothetical protein
MLANSNILQIAEFYPIVGNADNTRKASDATGGRFRAVNTDYDTNPVNPKFATPILKIFGDKVEVDRANERRGSDIASVRAADLLQFGRDLGKNFQKYFFIGDADVDVKQFNGLNKIIPDANKIGPASANGLQVITGNDNAAKKSQQELLELINLLILQIDGGAQALLANSVMISRLTTIAREFIQYTTSDFGEPIALFRNIPILPCGAGSDKAEYITNVEEYGDSNNCTSIKAIRFGEKTDLSIATNVGLEVKDLGLVGNFYTHSVDFDLDLVLLKNAAVAELQGIIIP